MTKTTHRLYLAGVALALFVGTLVVGNFCLPEAKRVTASVVGHDFLAFYTAGTFVREGRPQDLYDLPRVQAFQRDLARRENLEVGQSFGPFWNPPFYAAVFAPLAGYPYHTALGLWFGINVSCLFAALALLIRMLPMNATREAGLIPLLLIPSVPLIQALTHGQNTAVSLLILCTVVTLWRDRRAVAAGVVAGFLLYKPQLGALIAAGLVLSLGWRALAGLAVSAAGLLVATVVALPGTLGQYLERMPGNLRQFQVEQVYLWDRHVTLRAFWRLLLQGREAGPMSALATGCWIASVAAIGGLLAWAAWRHRKLGTLVTPAARDLFIAATIAAMPLLMPFYFDYDLLLLSVAVVLYANVRLHPAGAQAGSAGEDRRIAGALVALYAWLMVNAVVARYTRVNGTVILLALAAGLLARRAARARPVATLTLTPPDDVDFTPQALATAA